MGSLFQEEVRVEGKMDRFEYLFILEQQMLQHAENNMLLTLKLVDMPYSQID